MSGERCACVAHTGLPPTLFGNVCGSSGYAGSTSSTNPRRISASLRESACCVSGMVLNGGAKEARFYL